MEKIRIFRLLVAIGCIILVFWGLYVILAEPAPIIKRNTALRLRVAKAELDVIRESRGKDGKKGTLYPTDLWKPEVVLSVTLALIGEDFEGFGIKNPARLREEIKTHPENFRQEVPELKRKRFLFLTQEMEKMLGDKTEKRLLSEWKIYSDSKTEKRINAIAEKIIAKLPVKPPLKLYLVRNDDFNAFCLANGTVFVNSGLLERVQNDDELAFILAHEYAHFAARHGNEGLTKRAFTTAGDVLAEDKENKLISNGKEWSAFFVRFGYIGGAVIVFNLPYSREMETEADILGLRYMARAGYKPEASVALFSRIATGESSVWEKYLSTHPHGQKRIACFKEECARLHKYGVDSLEDGFDWKALFGGSDKGKDKEKPVTEKKETASNVPTDDKKDTPAKKKISDWIKSKKKKKAR